MTKNYLVVLFTLLLFTPCLARHKINGKEDLDRVRVDVVAENILLREAIQQLVAATKMQIVYNDAIIKDLRVSCSCRNRTLRQVLVELLKPTNLVFQVMDDGQIVILQPKATKRVNLQGYVKDAKTGATLPNANISLVGTGNGTASDAKGFFVLMNVPSGLCTLKVTYIGYKPVERTILARPDINPLTIPMEQQAMQLEGVTVTAENQQTVKVADGVSEIRLSPRYLSKSPSVGELDIFRSLQLLPGISAVNEGSSGLYVRGGTPDENLVLYDGMTLYHTDHFFGFISAFNTEAIQDVRVFKGGFPAKFGGRTSSVVELTGRSGHFDRFQVGGSVNFLSGSGIVQMPLAGRGSLLISFRRSYTDVIKNGLYSSLYNSVIGRNRSGPIGGGPDDQVRDPALGPQFQPQQEGIIPNYYYYDLNAKLTYALSANDLFSVSFYNSLDNLDQSQSFDALRMRPLHIRGGATTGNAVIEDVTKWKNLGVSGKWSRVWSDRVFSNLLAAYSIYSRQSESGFGAGPNPRNLLTQAASSYEDNEIRDFTLRFDNKWQATPSQEIEFGAWYSNTNIGLHFTANDTLDILNRQDEATHTAFYLQDAWQVLHAFELTAGLRGTYYGPTAETYFEPRASFKFSPIENLTFKGAWGKYHQFVNRITNENVQQGNRDLWLLADERSQPSFAEHKILGLTYESDHFLFDIEAYHKDLDGVIEFSQHFQRSPNPPPKSLFFLGTGISKGVEFLLQKKKGRLNGRASYTLGKVTYKFPAFNSGEAYPADQDRRHEIELVGSTSLGRWNLSATWVYASGAPYTVPETFESLEGSARSFVQFGDKNANRLPAYHRMDVSLSRQFSTKKFSWDLGLSVFNLYNHANVQYREFVLEADPMIVRDVTSLGITPTITLRVNLK